MFARVYNSYNKFSELRRYKLDEQNVSERSSWHLCTAHKAILILLLCKPEH